MIARILKWLMLLQVLAVLGLAYLAMQAWGVASPVQAVLLALAMLLAVRALVVARNFWQSRRLGSPVPQEYQLGVRGAARLFLGELRATLWASSWGMLRPRLHAADTVAGQGLPVLLIHGYVCNRGYWTQLSRQLARAGVVHDGVDLEPIGADIEQFVPQVEQAITELRARTGSDRVILVAHSMGGLVARAWLRRHGARRVARIITIGTPHHGTALANLAAGANARQMSRIHGAPDAWLAQLAASETPETRALITSIYSHHDNIVAPQSSAQLPDARNLAFGGIGHVALASDARVLRQLLEEITIKNEVAQPPSCPHFS
ncbi:alpha/beta fold hydrolase [Janthinobacterium lividum]|uniref:alpha/beta fold hydrolase n=1 Tax=Janthinobacterium lividum TaxID=29581 RepID=UPI00087494F0|nr:alpha/beta fold hydrolase [Janthinobacterium lividum]MCC7717255.1 alpha/beta fold hydrolase [Janthinobacterium lividum]OEZ58662.1 extracellular esterase EstB precursor [Janthinobacterium lividum]WQE30721.1 alpha/beta fold hydrolase [Janthinobacterium lividum]STQ96229.1 Extracellular esterase estB precursor [Janthinobacterium lividum]